MKKQVTKKKATKKKTVYRLHLLNEKTGSKIHTDVKDIQEFAALCIGLTADKIIKNGISIFAEIVNK